MEAQTLRAVKIFEKVKSNFLFQSVLLILLLRLILSDQKTSEASPLSEGERVVHLTDSGAELATVKWIGALPGKGDKIFAGRRDL